GSCRGRAARRPVLVLALPGEPGGDGELSRPGDLVRETEVGQPGHRIGRVVRADAVWRVRRAAIVGRHWWRTPEQQINLSPVAHKAEPRGHAVTERAELVRLHRDADGSARGSAA